MEISFYIITLSSTPVLIERLEKQSWFPQVNCWRPGFGTGKPQISLCSLEGFYAKLLLSGPRWAEILPAKTPLWREKMPQRKAALERNCCIEIEHAWANYPSFTYCFQTTGWQDRNVLWLHAYSRGNYFSETREEKRGDCNKAPAWLYRNPTFYL